MVDPVQLLGSDEERALVQAGQLSTSLRLAATTVNMDGPVTHEGGY